MNEPRNFFITHARVNGHDVSFAILDTHVGTEQQVRDFVQMNPQFPAGSYLLLEKNVTVITKAAEASRG